jgi:DNA-binding transcriptional ArsR family regulator
MSPTTPKNSVRSLRHYAPLFAALGDEVRLTLLAKLGTGTLLSITQLSEGSTITRQAITKHLRVLQDIGLVRGTRRGREHMFRLDPKPLKDARDSLTVISQQWDESLARLKSFVED